MLLSPNPSSIPSLTPRPAIPADDANDRFRRGFAKLREIDGEAGERVIAALAGLSPDLGRYIIEFGFGDVYSRPGLSLRERELATVAMLAARGGCEPQLKVHVAAALNVGISREEVVEVLLQAALYAGFPAALNATFAAGEVFGAYREEARPLAPVPVVKRLLAGLAEGRIDHALLAEQVRWRGPERGSDGSQPAEGRAAVIERLQAMLQEAVLEPLHELGAGEVLVMGQRPAGGPSFVLRCQVVDGLVHRLEAIGG